MSGGSFSYLFTVDTIDQALEKREDLDRMASALNLVDSNHPVTLWTKALAAQSTAELPLPVKTVWHAIEWWHSNDSNEEEARKILEQTRAWEPPPALHPDHERLMRIERNLHELLGAYEGSGILSASRVREAMRG